MIIDFHVHAFPSSLAGRALEKLASSARAKNYLDGTAQALSRSAREAGIDYSVLLPVVTKPQQQENINAAAIETNAHSAETGLISFGGIHPDNSDFRSVLRRLAESGIEPKVLQYIMGHANISVTTGIYTHLDFSRLQRQWKRCRSI